MPGTICYLPFLITTEDTGQIKLDLLSTAHEILNKNAFEDHWIPAQFLINFHFDFVMLACHNLFNILKHLYI